MAKVVHSSDFDKIDWIFKKRFHKKSKEMISTLLLCLLMHHEAAPVSLLFKS